MVSTPLKNISQNGNLPQIGVKKYIWNHHLENVHNIRIQTHNMILSHTYSNIQVLDMYELFTSICTYAKTRIISWYWYIHTRCAAHTSFLNECSPTHLVKIRVSSLDFYMSRQGSHFCVFQSSRLELSFSQPLLFSRSSLAEIRNPSREGQRTKKFKKLVKS